MKEMQTNNYWWKNNSKREFNKMIYNSRSIGGEYRIWSSFRIQPSKEKRSLRSKLES